MSKVFQACALYRMKNKFHTRHFQEYNYSYASNVWKLVLVSLIVYTLWHYGYVVKKLQETLLYINEYQSRNPFISRPNLHQTSWQILASYFKGDTARNILKQALQVIEDPARCQKVYRSLGYDPNYNTCSKKSEGDTVDMQCRVWSVWTVMLCKMATLISYS